VEEHACGCVRFCRGGGGEEEGRTPHVGIIVRAPAAVAMPPPSMRVVVAVAPVAVVMAVLMAVAVAVVVVPPQRKHAKQVDAQAHHRNDQNLAPLQLRRAEQALDGLCENKEGDEDEEHAVDEAAQHFKPAVPRLLRGGGGGGTRR
jgi:hypothetical protein